MDHTIVPAYKLVRTTNHEKSEHNANFSYA